AALAHAARAAEAEARPQCARPLRLRLRRHRDRRLRSAAGDQGAGGGMTVLRRVLAGLFACASTIAWAQAPSTTELPPLPAQPIEVPQLPAVAGKTDLLEAYFGVTGDPMLEGLVDQVAAVPESARRRA